MAEVLTIEELREPHRRDRRAARAAAERARGVRRGSRPAEARGGLPIYQPEREAQVLSEVRQSATELAGPLTAEAVVRIFERDHRRSEAGGARRPAMHSETVLSHGSGE